MRIPKNLFSSFWVSMILLLAIPLIVQADHRTIDTNDGLVDSQWATTVTVIDGADYPDPNWDIQQAWVTNEADNSFFYFRVQLLGKMPQNDWNGVEALLDCNNDGDAADPQDVIVFFAPGSTWPDNSGACQGDQWPDPCGNPTDGTYEEIIGNSPTDYEWKAPTAGTINYSACTGAIKVGFRTVAMTNLETFEFRDTTPWRNFAVPTQVTLSQLSAKNANSPLALFGLAGVLVLAVFTLRRFLR